MKSVSCSFISIHEKYDKIWNDPISENNEGHLCRNIKKDEINFFEKDKYWKTHN